MINPSDINDSVRLWLAAKYSDPNVLYDPSSFDRLFGRGRWAMTDRYVLCLARRLIESGSKGEA